jgi:diguanylate cyclase
VNFLRTIDWSARGRARVVLWTVFGTLGCILAAILLDSPNFMALDEVARLRAIQFDIAVPLLLAGPLFLMFSTKMRQLAIAHHQMTIIASTDSLTNCLNRGAFTTLVDAYLTELKLQAAQQRGALLVVDADHFKIINDTFGHARGDEALRLIAGCIKGTLRNADLVGRLGGEEFGVFLPGSTEGQAHAVAERIRNTINDVAFHPDGLPVRLTVSVGGAVFEKEVSFSELFRVADKRLYEAKENGRNRTILTRLGRAEPGGIALH